MKLAKQLVIGGLAVSCVAIFGTSDVKATTAIVDVKSLYLREQATTSSDMVDGLVQGQELEVLEELDDWYKVKVNGETGYVYAEYVTIKEDEAEGSNSVETVVEEETEEQPQQQEEKITPATTATVTSKSNNEFKIKEATLANDAKAYILPLINSNVLKNLKSGSNVTIYDEVNNWYYIQDDEISAWVLKSAFGEVTTSTKIEPEEIEEEENVEAEETPIVEEEQAEQPEETEQETEEIEIDRKVMYVNSSSIYVRKGPGTNYEDIDSLVLNNSVYVIGESGDWYKVEVAGQTGYIAKRLLSDSEQETTSRGAEERKPEENVEEVVTTSSTTTYSSIGEEIADFAQEYLGCPYVYGGSGPSSFDCSGFTMYVFKNFGVNLSHSATAQSKVGEYVAKEDLMPGDLVFFKDYQTMDGIGHVGIYIGDGNFVHASSGTGYCVKISTLLSGSYEARYETARRIF